MSINSILFQNTYGVREPALLNIDKSTNYDSLSNWLTQETSAATTTAATDKVDLALDRVAGKLITDLAAVTASAIGDYPELADDYVLVVIDGEGGREARVYSRDELVESGGGTDEEKAARRAALDKNPLVLLSSAEGLPASSQSEGAAALAERAGAFLKTNSKLLDLMTKYGVNPFRQAEEA
jgi:hypothetical protein